ncbi:hypothetical protein TIFTF001_041057 [Ficus carica]|uniref:F-box associated beta-propeller type 1 domain-containing protein n=1 Tax=Ficus carica TaxID=3494 RepID=A0AA87Z1E8_FICCA|nr:hypothetical protein TIFTF001_041057 [Ficus carica]
MDGTRGKRIKLRENDCDKVGTLTEIVENILLRFPVKSISEFNAVCKQWCKVIRTPSFTKKQLSLSKAEPAFILYPYVDDDTDLYLVSADGILTEKVSLPRCEDLSFLSMICSYNGLVCFTNCPWRPNPETTKVEIRICNPATRKIHLLPEGSSSEEEPTVGVAFGPSDYKVFRIFHPKSDSEDTLPECEVYSPSTGVWRGIGSVPKCPMKSHNIFVVGKVYWFLPSEDDHTIAGSILSVDMEENFQVIELPEEVTAHAFLVNLDAHLCLVAIYDDDLIMDIWLLKYKNETEYYWERICSDYIPYSTMENTDAAAGLKNEIFIITSEHYFLYDIGRRTWIELDFVENFQRNCPVIFSYTESLLPCNGVMGPEI